jgi:FtsP/CotA-like multicopper oxidase with cupredoxin domain
MDLPQARLWGYEGTFPDPTFDVMPIETVFVKWMNTGRYVWHCHLLEHKD